MTNAHVVDPQSISLSVRNVRKSFRRRSGLLFGAEEVSWAVAGQHGQGVSLDVAHGEVLAIVGESGSGKSTLGRVITGLIQPDSGDVVLGGDVVTSATGKRMFELRAKMQMVFQDPYSSLNPRRTIGSAIAQPLLLHHIASRHDAQERVEALLEIVGLRPAEQFAPRFPHQLSGGQRQRVAIARALACRPQLIVADEPIASLDVSVRATILHLLRDMRDKFGLTVVLITHDLAVVRAIADRVAVMYLGRIVEVGDVESVVTNPQHPYTRALISSAPLPDPALARTRNRQILIGEIPSPSRPPSGCAFHPRCPVAFDRCSREEPLLTPTSGGYAACHLLAD